MSEWSIAIPAAIPSHYVENVFVAAAACTIAENF
jgi:hypothetical protein